MRFVTAPLLLLMAFSAVTDASPKRKPTPSPSMSPSPQIASPAPAPTPSGDSSTGFWILTMLGVAAYFIPTAIAAYRKHPNSNSIFAMNLLLGGCFGIGWIIALVWALTAIDKSRTYR